MKLYSYSKYDITNGIPDITKLDPFNSIYEGNVYEFLGTKVAVNSKLITGDKLYTLQLLYCLNHNLYSKAIGLLEIYPQMHVCDYESYTTNDKILEIFNAINDGSNIREIVKLISDYTQHTQLYKVLSPNNESMHGGTYKWELNVPSSFIPYAHMCDSGYHLTDLPCVWAHSKCRIYKAIGTDQVGYHRGKHCFKTATLTEELDAPYIIRLDHIMRFDRCCDIKEALAIVESEYGVVIDDYTSEIASKYLEEFEFHSKVEEFLKSRLIKGCE